MSISVHNLHLRYGKREVLSGVDFSIPRGGFYAIMGANGCGKTTLMRCVANLLPPTSGSIQILGRDVNLYSSRQLAQTLSFVRQHATTDLEFSAFEIVLMGRNPYQRRLQNESQADHLIVEQAMKETNTWHLRSAKPHELSGGELQRVMLARALAQQTPIMLLDEPTSNLDISHQFEIMSLLRQFNQQQHKTILIVVHDLNLAYRYCPNLILLHHGSVFFNGPTTQGLTPDNVDAVFGVNSTIIDGNLIPSHK